MIELESYVVSGLKSLAEIERIPVRRPTIITGANDGGKTTTLKALEFLLGGTSPGPSDHTVLNVGADGAEPVRQERVEVTGDFLLDEKDVAELGYGKAVTLRRIAAGGKAWYELRQRAPIDTKLRGLETLGLRVLAELAGEYDLVPTGPRNAKASFLGPLRQHAAGLPHEDAWVSAPPELVTRLPRVMLFSSTAEPDPEGQIRSALKAAFAELLNESELVGPVRDVETKVQQRLAEKASDLCAHIADRCPELDSITVVPEVTFTEGFRSVQVLASREGGAGIALNQSGAGRRRRINLAIWEWAGDLLDVRGREDQAVVIAYDEPDTHLDYAHQRELVTLIHKQCAKPGVRMVVATHSLNLIDRVDIEDVVHLRLENEHTVVERLVASEHQEIDRYLASVSEAMGLRNSVLIHERCFVGVEGPTEVQAIPILFRLATGMSLQSVGIALIAGNGNVGALNVVRFLKEHGRKLAFVLVDADSAERKLFGRDRLQAVGIQDDEIHFIGAREFEDLFSDEQWAAAANAHWPRDDGEEWTGDDFTGLRSASKFSKAIENRVRGESSEAPPRKAGYLTALVQDIESAADVPKELATLFSKLAAIAAA